MRKQLILKFEDDFAAKWLDVLSEEQEEAITLAIKEAMIAYITMRSKEVEGGKRED